MTYFATTQTSYIDGPNLDAFGKLRVSDNACIFSSKMLYDNQPLIWDDEQVSGSGTSSTYSSNQATVSLDVGAATAGKRARRTFQYFNYQSANSQLIYMSGIFGTAASGITKNIGYFDNGNGLMFRQTTVMNVVVRTNTSGSTVETVVAQSAWNVDKLDGTGASGINVDFTKAQVFAIDFEWLGAGRIRFGVVLNGQIYYCHYISNLNAFTVPWVRIPSLPLTYDIENNGSGGSASLIQIASAIVSEGNNNPIGYVRSVNRGFSTISSVTNQFVPLISIRLQAGKTAGVVSLISGSVRITSGTESLIQLFLNPIIASADAASWVTLTNSNVEYDINRSIANTLTGGSVLFSNYISDPGIQYFNLDQLESAIKLGASISGTSTELVLGSLAITGNPIHLASLTFKEIM